LTSCINTLLASQEELCSTQLVSYLVSQLIGCLFGWLLPGLLVHTGSFGTAVQVRRTLHISSSPAWLHSVLWSVTECWCASKKRHGVTSQETL